MNKYTKLSSKKLISNKFVTLNENVFKSEKSHKFAPFYVLDFANWVNIAPITENKEVLLIKQFRAGIEDISIEIPGGIVDDDDLDPYESVKRELLEETGYVCDDVIQLNRVYGNPAIQTNYITGFLGINARQTKPQNLDTLEEIEFMKVPLDKIPSMINRGELNHPYAIITLLMTLSYFGVDYQQYDRCEE